MNKCMCGFGGGRGRLVRYWTRAVRSREGGKSHPSVLDEEDPTDQLICGGLMRARGEF